MSCERGELTPRDPEHGLVLGLSDMQMEQANLLTGTGWRRPAWLHWPVSTVLCLFALAWSPPAFALDAELYGRLLTEYTHEVSDVAGTRVDYRGLRASREWRQLVKSVRETSVEGSDRDATLAFWINAYNIVAIDMVAARLVDVPTHVAPYAPTPPCPPPTLCPPPVPHGHRKPSPNPPLQ